MSVWLCVWWTCVVHECVWWVHIMHEYVAVCVYNEYVWFMSVWLFVCVMHTCNSWMCMCDSWVWLFVCMVRTCNLWVCGCLCGWWVHEIHECVVLCVVCCSCYCISIHKIVTYSSPTCMCMCVCRGTSWRGNLICTAWCQWDFSCIYLWMTIYLNLFVCCCSNLMMFYNWHECMMRVLGTTKHS